MKKYFAVLTAFLALPFCGLAQQTINASITHDGMQRDYILYVPANYTGNEAVPLILNFHGYTSTATEQMWYGDFRGIADTAGFIIAHPMGTLYQGQTHWNVGGWTVGSTTDDVGFTSALIDSISAAYNIQPARIYSTGMSNGGYMSFLLACDLGNKIAAIASVTGSMTPEITSGCSPTHPTPILQIHGTSDGTVPYTGATWTNPVMTAVEYWANYNNCNMTPTITPVPNTNTSDGSTVEHYVYDGGDNGVVCEHFKVTGGDHTWPGTVFNTAGTNYDINASKEIWRFFSQYDINGAMGSVGMADQTNELELKLYPNPTNGWITVEGDFKTGTTFEVVSILGERLLHGTFQQNNPQIDLSQLPVNVYFLKVNNRAYKILKSE